VKPQVRTFHVPLVSILVTNLRAKHLTKKKTRTVILRIPDWPCIAWGPLLKTPGEQTLPMRMCGKGEKAIEYGRERAANTQPQTYRYSMDFTGNCDYSLHNIKRLVFVMVKQKLYVCLFFIIMKYISALKF
jgi:hypothetical protein